MKILIGQINPIIGDIRGNVAKVLEAVEKGRFDGADLVLTPELALCGYPPEDFLLLPHFIDSIEAALQEIIAASMGISVVVGLVRRAHAKGTKSLHNSAAIISDGRLIGFQDKSLLPAYDVFDEHRYFEPAEEVIVWDLAGERVAVTICEDIWQHAGVLKFSQYQRDPVEELKKKGVDLLLNLSSSPYHQGKLHSRIDVCSKAARTLECPVVLCNQIGGNDSLVFDGYSTLVTSKGEGAVAKGFVEDMPLWDTKAVGKITLPKEEMEGLYRALVLGVRDYFRKQGFKKACLGLSGGVDSALVMAIAVTALGAENVLAVAMPSRYSSDSSMDDAKKLVENLQVEMKVISIEEPFSSYLELLTPHFEGKKVDATEENLQARVRGMILMALSNKHGHIVLSTGNKSEMAMGYSTLYGDLAGGLSVISDVSKKNVYKLCNYLNRDGEVIPKNILVKPPSAELRPNQKDSDSLPDYDIVDAVLEGYIEDHLPPTLIAEKHGLDLDMVNELVLKIHRSEYKRRQAPPGLRVSARSFSVGRRFPIVQGWVV
jgi:NAD+ synthase (glutamine-hydrolysing)